MTVKVRFAPSPTGRLHVGNIRTALMNWLYAKSHGGSFLLRLDDTDRDRSTEEFADGIEFDLNWLGLTFDKKNRQSARFAEYDAAAEKLKADGYLYPCYETADELDRKRKIQRSRGLPPVYDRAALKLTDEDRSKLEADGRMPHWRFKLSGEPIAWSDMIRGDVTIDLSSLSDPILIREDGTYLYTLPSVVDDIEFTISHIIRGEDHVTNSGAQIEIFKALGGAPPTFGHHPLLTGAEGEGLSKRTGSLSIESLREEGIEPMAINSFLAKIGTSDAIEPRLSLDELLGEFDLGKLNRAPARFDPADLKALNAKLVHALPYSAVAERLADWNITGGEAFWEAVKSNLDRLPDVRDWWDIVAGELSPAPSIEEEDAVFLKDAASHLPAGPLTEDSWGNWTNALKGATGRKGRSLFMPLRVALTGQPHGPEMAKLLPFIGAEKVRVRLDAAAKD